MSWEDLPTDKQLRCIARLAARLGIHEGIEEDITTRGEAGKLIVRLQRALRVKHDRRSSAFNKRYPVKRV